MFFYPSLLYLMASKARRRYSWFLQREVPSAAMLTYLQHELAHAIWRLLLDDDLMRAYTLYWWGTHKTLWWNYASSFSPVFVLFCRLPWKVSTEFSNFNPGSFLSVEYSYLASNFLWNVCVPTAYHSSQRSVKLVQKLTCVIGSNLHELTMTHTSSI